MRFSQPPTRWTPVPADPASSIPSGLTVLGEAARLIPRTAEQRRQGPQYAQRDQDQRDHQRPADLTRPAPERGMQDRPRHQPHHRHVRLARRRPTASLHRRADARVEVAVSFAEPGPRTGSPGGPAQAAQERVRSARLATGRRPPAGCHHHHPAGCPLPVLRLRQPHPGAPFGPTPWRASYCCNHCRQPFEQFETGSTGRSSIPGGTGQTPSGAGGRDADAGGAPLVGGPLRQTMSLTG
jgi:hypothetical protein